VSERHQTAFAVPVDHPALSGHFPGAPVVPGVVVLDLVLKSLEVWMRRPARVAGLRQVKFHAPLLPEEQADLALDVDGDTLRFQVTRAGQLIAQGVFAMQPQAPSVQAGPESAGAAGPAARAIKPGSARAATRATRPGSAVPS
jgi:3-hydroxyacyl-[acyl-carrier-protein] dehydratase